MFGRASFGAVASSDTVMVPVDAVQYHEGTPMIFVRQADDLIEVRGVALGARHGDRLEIQDGLKPDEELVVARAYTLKSEMLKARLGAGCTDH
jgi:cobalt-zinc-cadmium efflux system membrane fusion protein